MPKSALEKQIQQTRYRDRIITILFVILLGLVVAYLLFPRTITVHRIPDPGRLLQEKIGHIPNSTIHSFARLSLESLYYCEQDCAQNIPDNIEALRSYISQSCANEIKSTVERNPNLYSGKSRKLQYINKSDPSLKTSYNADTPLGRPQQTVTVLEPNQKWHVDLEYGLAEAVLGYQTIDTVIRFPVRVIRSSLPKLVNEYQLTFDCYYEETQRMKKEL